jgi:Ca2+-binding EF-hand superfamily protein
LATAAFNAADTNKDGSIDANEFHRFIGSQNQYVYQLD